MTLEYCKEQMKLLEQKAKDFPEKKAIYRLQYRALQCALNIYFRYHPQEKLDNQFGT
jgi:hypothetical protein